MTEAKITFLTGKYILLKKGDTITPFGFKNNTISAPEFDSKIELEPIGNDGMIPIILKIICTYEFFFINDVKKAYRTDAVVTVREV